MSSNKLQWILAAIVPVICLVQFSPEAGVTQESAFLPGATSHGHHQIELQCSACHSDDMGLRPNACTDCHQAELKRANDSHPKAKFLDPRNADRVEILDARNCVTCHREHSPETTLEMGLTLPADYCFFCHQDIEEDRPTHKGLPFDSCSTAGCHNYHDNTALYEDFLEQHLNDKPFAEDPRKLPKNHYHGWSEENRRQPLGASDRDSPDDVAFTQSVVYDWSLSAHAKAGVNCSDCHEPEGAAFVEKPGFAACQSCHDYETETFLESMHGMRLAAGLSPMTPALAEIPMHQSAAHKELSCVACHDAHSSDVQFASRQACISCHDSEHVNNYRGSLHAELWTKELAGEGPPDSGVSCATCHFPRVERNEFGEVSNRVLHNQNETLRPNEKMIRPVCLQCHGLGFAIDALADQDLIRSNFQGRPQVHVESLEMVEEKLRRLQSERSP
ncbi:cytochrome c3 family protein [Pelagicoccus sp. SDUM812003]|uniref:cytochrome c3 family protein n=1 Tax=Pelagicoccus sp. SDUM812003 TaxID=3041267 RepID=UPI00281075B7|nr:cytochrome c3 family protein [Pelagicoccus sp. SDUM812003]MDQ8203703.1 cytochrome c3 family protein [Pelagicoccus sp. SDUM812003]